MINIIIALKATKGRDNISLVLAKRGSYNIVATVTSGADVLKAINIYKGGGVVICSDKLSDMHYTHLSNLLPENYSVLLIKKTGGGFYGDYGNMTMLVPPFTASHLLASIDTLALKNVHLRNIQEMQSKEQSRKVIDDAKAILMGKNNMTEQQAHRFIQKRSMDTRVAMNTIAQEIIRLYQ